MNDDTLRVLMFLFSILLFVGGVYLLVRWNWELTCGVFLVLWAKNVFERT